MLQLTQEEEELIIKLTRNFKDSLDWILRDKGYDHRRVIHENGLGYGENTVSPKYRGQKSQFFLNIRIFFNYY